MKKAATALVLLHAMLLYKAEAGDAHMHTVHLPLSSWTEVPIFLSHYVLPRPRSMLVLATSMLVLVSRSSQHDYDLYFLTTAKEYARTIHMLQHCHKWHHMGTWSLVALIHLLGLKKRNTWWESLWFTNDYEDEEYYKGWTIWQRCVNIPDEWWQIQCYANVLPDKASMLNATKLWRARLPMCSNMATRTSPEWSLWEDFEWAAPKIPLYMPEDKSKKKAMRRRRGHSMEAVGNQFKVPFKELRKIYALWS